jgi:hypothetical protein
MAELTATLQQWQGGVGYTGETVGSFVTWKRTRWTGTDFAAITTFVLFPAIIDDASFGILVFCYSLAEDAHLVLPLPSSSTPAAI